MSGSECVEALELAGFSVRSRTDDATFLAKGTQSVVVRASGLLMPEELVGLLRDAGLAYSDFLDLLSEAPTDPDLRRSSALRATSSAPPR